MPAKNGKFFVCQWCQSEYYAAKYQWSYTKFCSAACKASSCSAKRHAPDAGTAEWAEYKRAYDIEYRRKNLDRIKSEGKLRRGSPEQKAARKVRLLAYRISPEGRAQVILTATRLRAERKGIPFNLTYTWLVEKFKAGTCEATGLPLDFGHRPTKASPWAPSLDRTIPELGYTADNVKVVCWAYNTAKGSWLHDDVVVLAKAIMDRNL